MGSGRVAAPPVNSLEELLEALGRTRKLSERLRVLGHAWSLLRSLTPAERERVGLRLGSDWAWRRLERTLLRDGQLSEKEQLLGRVFERLGDADPGELRALASAVRTGDREGLKDMLLIELHEALEMETDASEGEAVSAPPAETAGGAPVSADEPAVVRVPQVEGAKARDVGREAPEAASPPEQRPRPPIARADPPRARPGPTPLPPSTPPLATRSELAPLPDVEPERATGPERAERPVFAADGAERMRILRSLERDPRPGATLGRDGRARLIASLGGGWASRRALSRMISGDGLDGVGEALQLIEGLARPSQRMWCLADLIEHRDLDPETLDTVIAAAPSEASRRRLARRAASSTHRTTSVARRAPRG